MAEPHPVNQAHTQGLLINFSACIEPLVRRSNHAITTQSPHQQLHFTVLLKNFRPRSSLGQSQVQNLLNFVQKPLQLASLLGRELKLIKPFVWMPRAIARRAFKEVIQPQVPLRLPCYDFTPVMNHTVVTVLPKVRLATSGATHSHGVTGGVYKARERIHRDILIRDY